MMKGRLSLILVLCMLLSLGTGCALGEAPDTQAPEGQAAVKAATTQAEEDLVQTHHTLCLFCLDRFCRKSIRFPSDLDGRLL